MLTALVLPAPSDAGARDKSASHWRYTRQTGRLWPKMANTLPACHVYGQMLTGLSSMRSGSRSSLIARRLRASVADEGVR